MLPSVDCALCLAQKSLHQARLIAPDEFPTYARIHDPTGLHSSAAHHCGPGTPEASLIGACEPAHLMVLNIDEFVSAQRHLNATILLPSDAANAQVELPNGKHRWRWTV